MSMKNSEYRMLNEVVADNNDDSVRRKLVSKYNNYYRLWQDFTLLVALFAIIGLVLAVMQWEKSFDGRGPKGDQFMKDDLFTQLIVLVISVMGALAIFAKFYFKAVWSQYKNPVAFYKSMTMTQVAVGLVDEESLTDNYKLESPIRFVLCQPGFWFELMLMLVIPLPYDELI